jgi:drug/metabolite transporter (DMT)-like permease
MIYLILAILFSTGVFVAMRLFERFKLDNHQALMWNYVFAAGTGFLLCKQFDTPAQLVAEPWFGLSLITGFWFIFTYLLMTASAQRSGVTVTSLSSKLSVVLPTLAGVVLFHEKLGLVPSIGIVLALVALVLVVGGKSSKEGMSYRGLPSTNTLPPNVGRYDMDGRTSVSMPSRSWLLPVLIFFGTGTGDILMKLTEQRNAGNMGFMIAFIYFIAMLFGILIVAYDLIRGKSKWQWKSALGGIGLGIINFFSTFCVYNAMRCFDNVVLFPVYNIGVVSVTALTGWLLFKEKLTWKNYLGLAIAIIAVILITFKP